MTRFNRRNVAAALIAVAGTAAAANADTHWWTGAAGAWDDPSKWAASPGGAGGHGAPTSGDVARYAHDFNLSNVAIDYANANGLFTDLLQVDLSGLANGLFGYVNFTMDESVLKADTMTFGRFGNTTITHTGGWIDAETWLQLGNGWDATTLNMSGGAILTARDLWVGRDGGGATINQSAGSVTVDNLVVAYDAGTESDYVVTGGTIDVEFDLFVGSGDTGDAPLDCEAYVDVSGGDVETRNLIIGSKADGLYLHGGGDLTSNVATWFGDIFGDGGKGLYWQTDGVATHAGGVYFYEATAGLGHQIFIDGGQFNTTIIDVAADRTVIELADGTMTLSSVFNLDADATAEFSGGDAFLQELRINDTNAEFLVSGADVQAADVNYFAAGALTVTAGSLTCDEIDVPTSTSTFDVSGGVVDATRIETSGAVTISGGDVQTPVYDTVPLTAGVTTVTGTGRLFAEQINNGDDFRIESGVTAGTVGAESPYPHGVFVNANSGRLFFAGGTFHHDLINNGNLILETNFACRGRITNNRDLTLAHDLISRDDLFETNAEISLNGQTIGCDNGPVHVRAFGAISGSGDIDADLLVDGDIFCDQIDVDGNLQTDGVLVFNVTNTTNDEMNVFGSANLGGTLRIAHAGPAPGVGETWTVINANAVVGAFDAIELLPADPGFDIEVITTSTRVIVQVTPAVCEGDVDGDLDVDFEDLNLLLSNWAATGSDVTGDLNDSGRVDFADLNILLGAWGDVCD